MISKCDHPGCTKAGTCRAPKTRDLKDYWWFCKEHAAEYNKNWNYYADMTPDEIEADWEKETFGTSSKNKEQAAKDEADYINFLNDFITGRSTYDRVASKKVLPTKISSAFSVLGLNITASWREVGAKYRALAKKYHPDITHNKTDSTAEFTRVTNAYEVLKKYFKEN
ncbi:MAG: DnaJ domain-containing protein [Alphaproteobacteria bacterium]|nr:DnaJ domain-containing protein [Alphaproteobacteria bacterium]